jgi:hypothetical protein
MSHLQANLRTSVFYQAFFWGPKFLLFTVLFVSKAADRWVVVDGLLSWCSFHFQLGWTISHNPQLEVIATPGHKDHPILLTVQQPSKQKITPDEVHWL